MYRWDSKCVLKQNKRKSKTKILRQYEYKWQHSRLLYKLDLEYWRQYITLAPVYQCWFAAILTSSGRTLVVSDSWFKKINDSASVVMVLSFCNFFPEDVILSNTLNSSNWYLSLINSITLSVLSIASWFTIYLLIMYLNLWVLFCFKW